MPTRERSKITNDPDKTDIDRTDRAILRELQRDGRRSYAALGALVGLSAPAVRQRVQRLTSGGVLRVAGLVDPIALGRPAMAMLGIRTSGDPRPVADAVGALPEVGHVVLTAGSYQLFAEIACASARALLDLVEDRIKPLDGVSACETFPYFAVHTNRFTWDTP
ncbi:Lrp/AsnC family transcriptional regulator [Acrocarpospora corrugata]|uniref:Lrp/AsnC family transcriptional regulator n=1 Tax=Acrocarpospora corrugata TaxID=35763 RepID=UPI001C3FB300|nr:Lrp/AsnC family transcriptional regulator [Acrocarpospora corrugata]